MSNFILECNKNIKIKKKLIKLDLPNKFYYVGCFFNGNNIKYY